MIKRIITGFFLILFAILAVSFGGSLFLAWIMLVSLLAFYELIRMSKVSINMPLLLVLLVLMGSLLIFFYSMSLSSSITIVWMVFSVVLLTVFMFELIRKKLFFQSHSTFVLFRCFVLFAMICPYFFWIRELDNGIALTYLLLFLIAASDISAYFGGKYFGSHPLSSLSPNKTIEGSVFALIGSVTIAMASSCFISFSLGNAILLGVLVSIFTQLGDLHESLTKRFYNCKDSSQILPGHGGFYDRLDGYIFAMPIFFILMWSLKYV